MAESALVCASGGSNVCITSAWVASAVSAMSVVSARLSSSVNSAGVTLQEGDRLHICWEAVMNL